MISELVERLLRKVQRFPATGGGSIGIDADGKTTATSYITDDGYRLVNPDGPAAADLIQRLLERDERMREALEILRVRECGSWCDPSLNEHTSYCRNAKATLSEVTGDK